MHYKPSTQFDKNTNQPQQPKIQHKQPNTKFYSNTFYTQLYKHHTIVQ